MRTLQQSQKLELIKGDLFNFVLFCKSVTAIYVSEVRKNVIRVELESLTARKAKL